MSEQIKPSPTPDNDYPASLWPPRSPPLPWAPYPYQPGGLYEPPPAPAAPSRTETEGTPFAVVSLLGGALVAIGSFVTWATVADGTTTVVLTGLDNIGGRLHDGVITLPVGIAIIMIAIWRLTKPPAAWLQRSVALLAVLAMWIVAVDLPKLLAMTGYHTAVNAAGFTYGYWTYTGPGLYVILIGAVLTFLGSLVVSRVVTR